MSVTGTGDSCSSIKLRGTNLYSTLGGGQYFCDLMNPIMTKIIPTNSRTNKTKFIFCFFFSFLTTHNNKKKTYAVGDFSSDCCIFRPHMETQLLAQRCPEVQQTLYRMPWRLQSTRHVQSIGGSYMSGC
jgi:hypothetical protein